MARKRIYTVYLSPTPVTPAMREQVVNLATKQGRSMADIVRSALVDYLQKADQSGGDNGKR